MTFSTEGKVGIFVCDTCPEHIECHDREADFTLCWIFAKRFGWRSYKGPDQKWAHACAVCTATYAEEQAKKRGSSVTSQDRGTEA